MAGVFLSYRRDDAPGHAGRIFDRLRAAFGADVVFMDVYTLDAGVDFATAIDRAVGSCATLLAIIGPDWMSKEGGQGRTRLQDPDDFVRLEIARALARNVAVIPVLVNGASLPAVDDLPDELRPIARRQAVALRDSRWDADVDHLVQSVAKLLESATGAPARMHHGASDGRLRRSLPWVGAAALLVAGVAWLAPRGGGDESADASRVSSSAAPTERASPSAAGAPGDAKGSSSPTADNTRPATQPTGGVPDATPAGRSPSDAAASAGPRSAPPRRGLGVGWFGLWLDSVTASPPGVIVGRVADGGPAANAGLQADDVLVRVAGRPVTSFSDVGNVVAEHVGQTPRGTAADVEVMRNGQPLTLRVVFDRDFVLPR
jgi:hypothetical protein